MVQSCFIGCRRARRFLALVGVLVLGVGAGAQLPAIPDTNYPVPPGAVFVAPNGADNNTGNTPASPWTLRKALSSAPDGATIVLRGGNYYQAGTLYLNRRLILQPHPHEQAWIKGSKRVTGWTPDGAAWRSDGWTTGFPNSQGPPGGVPGSGVAPNVTLQHPLAGNRDMVFVDDIALTQVARRDQVGPGEFFVDYTGDALYIGNDPVGKIVEATTKDEGLVPEAAGSVFRGLGFAHFADQAVTVRAPQVRLENNIIAWNGLMGVRVAGRSESNQTGVFAPDCIVSGNTFAFNGRLGLHAERAHRLVLENNVFRFNNEQRFGKDWDAAGVKIIRSENIVVRDNLFEHNYATGLWMDVSVFDARVVHNVILDNEHHGIHQELSHQCIVAFNVIAGNHDAGSSYGDGIFVSDSSSIRVFNNTLANNGTALRIADGNRITRTASEMARGITWISRNNVAKNNLYVGGLSALFDGGNCGDPNKAPSAVSTIANDHNGFHRLSSASPARAIVWSPGGADCYRPYTSLGAYRSAVPGRETNSVSFDNVADPFFVDAANRDFRLRAGSAAINRGEALPPDIAQAAGVAQSPVHLGALGVYTAPPPAPTPTPAPAPTPAPVNLAQNGSATQSSTLTGTAQSGNGAQLALDGDTSGHWKDGSVTHTQLQKEPWWEVDLEASRAIATIEIFNRTDSVPGRLSNFHVLVSDTPFGGAGLDALRSRPDVWRFHHRAVAGAPTKISVHRLGRYVRVQLAGTGYLSLAEVKVMGYANALPNLGLNQTATQSSRPQGTPAPGAALDGNTNGNWTGNSVTHTSLQHQPWWQVDLGQSQNITTLNLFNRTDNSQARLGNVHVFVSDQPFTATDLAATLKQPGVWHGYVAGTVGAPSSVPVHYHGRYVRIQLMGMGYLSLAEVQVLGFPNPNPNTNLALNKSATQSSRPQGTPAPSAALDGNTNGNWTGGSITHTNLENQPWWQLDLGQSHSLTHLELFNRTDNSQARLSNFTVLVSDTPFPSTSLPATLAQPGVTATHLPTQAGAPTSVPLHRTGRYVRIQLAGTGYLSLAEVKVMGLPIAGLAGNSGAAGSLVQPSARLLSPVAGSITGPANASQPREANRRVAAKAPSSEPATVSTPLASGAHRQGTGLIGEYFDNMDGTDRKTVRLDPTIDFDWGKSVPPGTGLTHHDTWSVSWTGWVEAPITGTYTFTTTSDDGIRLWVNHQLLVNDGATHASLDNRGQVYLQAGRRYALRVEYFERYRLASVKLQWSFKGQARQTVPQSRLYPTRKTSE